jgi:hypothetical protein
MARLSNVLLPNGLTAGNASPEGPPSTKPLGGVSNESNSGIVCSRTVGSDDNEIDPPYPLIDSSDEEDNHRRSKTSDSKSSHSSSQESTASSSDIQSSPDEGFLQQYFIL